MLEYGFHCLQAYLLTEQFITVCSGCVYVAFDILAFLRPELIIMRVFAFESFTLRVPLS